MVAAPSPSAIAGLEPAAVWKFFGNLADLPRPSKHEQKVQAFLKDFAQARGLEVQSDAAGKSCGHVTSSADDTACTVWEPSGGRCAGSDMLLVAGNMVIRRPGSGGGEAAPTVIIQGHIDMQVCKCHAVAGSALLLSVTLRMPSCNMSADLLTHDCAPLQGD